MGEMDGMRGERKRVKEKDTEIEKILFAA